MYSNRNNLIIGFHGCDEDVRNNLVTNPNVIHKSEKPYDWLGHGFYFWENNFERALQWAKDKQKNGKIKTPSVVGAVIFLDYCLDFTDNAFIDTIGYYYDLMKSDYKSLGKVLPSNKDVKQDAHKDLLIRELDCSVIEYMHQKIEEKINEDIQQNGFSNLKYFDSAKGIFTEGGPAFEGAGIQKKNHIQICIRNMNCIKGFFIPRKETKFP